ncbi:MAG: hypothetical protein J2P17_32985 [Mycobacterium sp.]|nr:hypothetical protein [Mycobacterium sp.]
MSESTTDHTVDEIARETGQVFRQIIEASRTWIHRHADSIRLSREQKKELREHIRREIGERKVTYAWFTKRANDYRAEAARVDDRRRSDDPNYTVASYKRDLERLDKMQNSIEAGLSDTVLPLEQRGQVVQALEQIRANPRVQVGPIFKPLTANQTLFARNAAIQSQIRVHAYQASIDANLREQQRIAETQSAKRSRTPRKRQARPTTPAAPRPAPAPGPATVPTPAPATTPARPAADAGSQVERAPEQQRHLHAVENTQGQAVTAPNQNVRTNRRRSRPAANPAYYPTPAPTQSASMNNTQIGAVQEIRAAQVRYSREIADPQRRAANHTLVEKAAQRAARAGLSNDQINWEISNAAGANSRCHVQIAAARANSDDPSRYNGYFPDEREATAWAQNKMRTTKWQPGVRFTVSAYETGHDEPFFRSAGEERQVSQDVTTWHKDAHRDLSQTRRERPRQQQRPTLNPRRTTTVRKTTSVMRTARTARRVNSAATRAIFGGRHR